MSTTDLTSFNALPTYKQDILLAVNALRGRVGFFMDSGPLIWKLIDAAEKHVLKGGKVEDYVGTARAVLARTNAVHSSQVLAQVGEEMAKLTAPAPTSEEIEAAVEAVEAEEVFGEDLVPTLDGPVPALSPVEIVLSALRLCGAEPKALQYACDIARRMTWHARTAEAVAQRIRNLPHVSKTALRLALQSEAREAKLITEPTSTFPAPVGASAWERRMATPLHLLND